MKELNFKIPQNDGRNRCRSISPWSRGDELIRCQLEINHSLDHASAGMTWTDEQERKVVKTLRHKWTGYLVRSIGLVMWVLSYWVIKIYSEHNIPLGLLLVTLITFASVFICCAGWVISDVHEEVRKKNGK